MLRPASSLLALALCLSTLPALADDPQASDAGAEPRAAAPPRVEPPRALPPPSHPYWPPPPVPTQRRSGGAVAGGIVLTVAGSLGFVVGTGIYQGASGNCELLPIGPGGQLGFAPDCSDETGKIVGMTVLITSAVVVGGGIALWVYGGQQVPKREQRDKPDSAASARPGVAFGLGPGAATLRWSF